MYHKGKLEIFMRWKVAMVYITKSIYSLINSKIKFKKIV